MPVPPMTGHGDIAVDVAAWDARYAGKQHGYLKSLCNTLAWKKPALAGDPACSSVIAKAPTSATHDEWNVHDWAMSLASMYEATGDAKYLDELGELDDVLVAGRGAHDDVRARFYEGWVIDRGCAWGSLDVTGLFSAMLARYARLVAEHPDLDADQRAKAVKYAANAAKALADIPANERADEGIALMYLVTPGAQASCTAQITAPGLPYPYNMDHLIGGAMLDLEAVGTAEPDLPKLWTQWKLDAIRTTSAGELAFARWPTGLAPDGKDRIDDAAHAAVTADFVSRLARDGWIDAVPYAIGAAQTLMDVTTVQGSDGTWEFPGGMDGTANANVWDRAQVSCSGWARLASARADVLERCAAETLQIVDGAQPNVTPGNYAALLAMVMAN